MFDKMILSEADDSASGGRGRYFIVSGLVVGALFVSAVVLSIYAVDLDLGTDEFDLSRMLAPVTAEQPEPVPEDPPPSERQQIRQNEASRIHNILRPDEQPLSVPDSVSTSPNRFMSRPPGEFVIGKIDSIGTPSLGDTGTGRGSPAGTGSSMTVDPGPVVEKVPPPPPVVEKPRAPVVRSKGVVNGAARYLPHPPYPPAARAMRIQGSVSVQVTIDEKGVVLSAKAVDGHPMLRRVAENAASSAKFDPTRLSDVPVKVTGVIVYNFKL